MATDYAIIVTSIYFIVYMTIFLIVSFICAINVGKEYKNHTKNIQQIQQNKLTKWSKKEMVKRWIKSVWKKKQIYFQLMPHFFDQATDFGAICEYWRLRNHDIGINTMYLFTISIFIICLHRVVSSLAIYQLTKKKLFILYQLLDVLMIRCIWTNYELDTDEPSNCQRYLQVLEAIFESSPQILISTAFLIKATTSEINSIVIMSLIVSFWTLSARVSSDDKQMFKEKWKSFKHENCYFINYRWFIRVVLWRFLEITSRIALLCLVWINLGGVSVFIILALESIYLCIISFALGTVDLMGNTIYLMAANSNKKSEQWAVKMTKIFWAYRVISAYILLIISCIFATTKFDATKIQEYDLRYNQTIENKAGLGVLIFSCVATPIWQWVGAVIIFDYGNLSSVGRDVAQLIQDKKYKDVLELITFGADFDAEDTLKMILNAKNQTFTPINGTKSKIIDSIERTCLDQMEEKQIIESAFFRACNLNDFDMVEYLITNSNNNANFDVNVVDQAGRSALFYAAANNSLEMVKLLYQYKADLNIIDNNGLKAIHYMFQNNAIQKDLSAAPEVMKIKAYHVMNFFIDVCGVDVNDVDKLRQTPLFHAAASNSIELVRVLYECKANCNITDQLGATAIHHMFQSNMYQNPKLLSNTKDVHSLKIVTIFIEKMGFDLGLKNMDNNNILDTAILTNQPQLIRTYLKEKIKEYEYFQPLQHKATMTDAEVDEKLQEMKLQETSQFDVSKILTPKNNFQIINIMNDTKKRKLKRGVSWRVVENYEHPIEKAGPAIFVFLLLIGSIVGDIAMLNTNVANECNDWDSQTLVVVCETFHKLVS